VTESLAAFVVVPAMESKALGPIRRGTRNHAEWHRVDVGGRHTACSALLSVVDLDHVPADRVPIDGTRCQRPECFGSADAG
jgi:hypothetical protein